MGRANGKQQPQAHSEGVHAHTCSRGNQCDRRVQHSHNAAHTPAPPQLAARNRRAEWIAKRKLHQRQTCTTLSCSSMAPPASASQPLRPMRSMMQCLARTSAPGSDAMSRTMHAHCAWPATNQAGGRLPLPWQIMPACSAALMMQLLSCSWPLVCTTMAAVMSLRRIVRRAVSNAASAAAATCTRHRHHCCLHAPHGNCSPRSSLCACACARIPPPKLHTALARLGLQRTQGESRIPRHQCHHYQQNQSNHRIAHQLRQHPQQGRSRRSQSQCHAQQGRTGTRQRPSSTHRPISECSFRQSTERALTLAQHAHDCSVTRCCLLPVLRMRRSFAAALPPRIQQCSRAVPPGEGTQLGVNRGKGGG